MNLSRVASHDKISAKNLLFWQFDYNLIPLEQSSAILRYPGTFLQAQGSDDSLISVTLLETKVCNPVLSPLIY